MLMLMLMLSLLSSQHSRHGHTVQGGRKRDVYGNFAQYGIAGKLGGLVAMDNTQSAWHAPLFDAIVTDRTSPSERARAPRRGGTLPNDQQWFRSARSTVRRSSWSQEDRLAP